MRYISEMKETINENFIAIWLEEYALSRQPGICRTKHVLQKKQDSSMNSKTLESIELKVFPEEWSPLPFGEYSLCSFIGPVWKTVDNVWCLESTFSVPSIEKEMSQ